MAVTINASTSGGLVTTADTSGVLNLQSNGTTVATVASTGMTVAGGLTYPDGVQQTKGVSGNGSAPMYACRAWVNFNGTGTVAIRASGNVSSITDNGTGDYTVNFTTAMPDANYSSVVTNSFGGSYAFSMSNTTSAGAVSAPTTTSMRFTTLIYNASNFSDSQYCHVAIFR